MIVLAVIAAEASIASIKNITKLMTDHHKFRNKPTTQAWSTSMYLYNLLKEKEHSFKRTWNV